MRILVGILLCMCLSFSVYAEKLEEIIIFGESIAAPETNLPANIRVIGAEEIKATAPSTTVELLESIQGVSVKSYDAKHVSVDLGGYGAEKGGLNSVILLNGRRIISPDMSGVDWSFIPVSNLERVEIFQGGNSVIFGDRAIGGAINLVTKKPVKSGFSAKIEGGSFNTLSGSLSGQIATDKLAVLLSAGRYSTDGYRDNSELRVNSGSGDVTYYFDKGRLNLYVNGSSSKYGLPGSLSETEINLYGRDYSATPDDGGTDHEQLYGAGAVFNLPAGELSINADLRKRHRDYAYYYSFGVYDTVDNLKSRALNPRYTLKTGSGLTSNSLTAGLDYIKYDVDAKTASPFGNSFFELEREMTGLYVSDRFEFRQLFFEAGYRNQQLDDSFKSENIKKDESEDAYNFTAGYDFKSAGKVYLRYDRSFRFPTTDELREYYGGLNTDIKTQTSNEISAGYSLKKAVFYLDARLYTSDTDNEIFTNPDFVPFSNYNLDTKRKGSELTVGAEKDGLKAEAAYSYVDAEVSEGAYNGREIPLLSKHKVKAVLSYKSSCGISFGYIAKYYSSAYAGNDTSNSLEKIDAYAVSDLKLGYEKGGFDIYLKVNNIFNERYYDYAFRSSYSESYYPAPDRNYSAGVSYKF